MKKNLILTSLVLALIAQTAPTMASSTDIPFTHAQEEQSSTGQQWVRIFKEKDGITNPGVLGIEEKGDGSCAIYHLKISQIVV